ncbi:MAG: YihY/virulence factor BrkB family protein [Actinomycetia bacterium]|nr:YihY/virulence factor BrkB family protein [Actinomycetes bacterium]
MIGTLKFVGLGLMSRLKTDNLTVTAAGVAFFGLLSLVPALVATISIYGLVADTDDVVSQVEDLASSASPEVQSILEEQMEGLAGGNSAALGVSLAVSVLLAVWSASGAINNLMKAINFQYRTLETRKGWMVRLMALVFTLGTILFVVAAVFLVAVLPAMAAEVGFGDAVRWALGITRFPMLALMMVVGLSVLYRFAPSHPERRPLQLLSPGAVVATLLWVMVSAAFSIYTANLGSYNETYGSMAGVVILLMFLWLTALVVLVGATINHLLETRRAEQEALQVRASAPTEGPTRRVGVLVGVAAMMLADRLTAPPPRPDDDA